MKFNANPINSVTLDVECSRAQRRSFGYADVDTSVKHWLATTWRRWICRQPELFMELDSYLIDARVTDLRSLSMRLGFREYAACKTIPVEKLFEHAQAHWANGGITYEVSIGGNWCVIDAAWQWRELMNETVTWYCGDAVNTLTDVLDWIRMTRARPTGVPRHLLPPADLTRLAVEEAITKSQEWHAAQKDRLTNGLTTTGIRKEIAPGIFRLLDSEALEYEGQSMHHCVASYWQQVESGSTAIYHIDSPRCTAQFTDGQLIQLRGPCNEKVIGLSADTLKLMIEDSTSTSAGE